MIDFAAIGVYSMSYADVPASPNEEVVRERRDIAWNTARDQEAWMFERMSDQEIDAMFEISGDQAVIRPGSGSDLALRGCARRATARSNRNAGCRFFQSVSLSHESSRRRLMPVQHW